MKKLESEIKYQLHEVDFYVVKNYLNKKYQLKNKVEQINYYIDTPNLDLYKRGISMRIRYKKSKFELTIKINKLGYESNSSIHIKDEYTFPLETDLAYNIINSNNINLFNNILSSNNLIPDDLFDKLIILGNLNTYREKYKFNDSIDFTLDVNTYLGIIDYEIEIEVNEELLYQIESKLLAIFNKLYVKPIKNFDSKSKRFKKKLVFNNSV